ncbi:MBL fold metallo-hydrolase [Kocuria sp. LUK]|uniref:MBL fold metallo-hydrolase n=1 Tax=Kocuria sp. LUK TaxID=2897828 RepID=UPI001E4BA294|nr:MBL fold metallo-hydrolase [Kocuria sp. LUK]MCD1144222.1 MBL fold metallo-hydrolase [Kocuria sp. LUK]
MEHDPAHGMRVVTLGTAGGPLLRPARDTRHRSGIATAVVVDSAVYLVDCGHGAGLRLAEAGLSVTDLRGVFITHHHSDHTIDLNSLMVLGGLALRGHPERTVPVLGPGRRGTLPPASGPGEQPDPVFPDAPTPGTADLVELLLRAHATDLNDRRRDSRAPDLSRVFRGEDIVLPSHVGFHPDEANHPEMEPLEVFRDDRVTVTATLVQHRPMAPAFAFRVDSAHGSVTVSGDTAPSTNLVRLAAGCDLLLHEAIDLEAVAGSYRAPAQQDLEASMGHHRRAHTTPEDAGRIATAAGVRTLALHHLVPAHAPEETWLRAADTFAGELLVPADGESIPVRR